MERDFLGLGSKNASITIKEEVADGSKDSDFSAPLRSSGIQWSFSNKVSAIPQFLSFKPTQEDKSRKTTVHDGLPSSGFMPIPTSEAFDSNQKPLTGVVQKNVIYDKQGGNHYVMTSQGLQQIDTYPSHRSQEMKMFPVSNQSHQTIRVPTSPHLGSSGQNVVTKTMNPQPLGGVSFVNPISVLPPQSSIVGTTDPRSVSKPSDAPAQLTIFYGGSVCVYDEITPEKAQAIMLLAGNGPPMTQNKMVPPTAQMQAPISRPFAVDSFFSKAHPVSSTCLGISSSIPTTSPFVSQAGGASSSTNELITTSNARTCLASSANQMESPKVVSSSRTTAKPLVSSVAVPQARKASLARFLEKRKERVLNTSPYNITVKSPENSNTVSEDLSLSVNSGGSSHLRHRNQKAF